MLEPPWLGISNTHNLCFVSKIRKIGIPPANSSFSIDRSGVYGGIHIIDMLPSDVMQDIYTPGIYADGYIVFAFPFVRSYVRLFVSSFVIPERSWNLCQSFC